MITAKDYLVTFADPDTLQIRQAVVQVDPGQDMNWREWLNWYLPAGILISIKAVA